MPCVTDRRLLSRVAATLSILATLFVLQSFSNIGVLAVAAQESPIQIELAVEGTDADSAPGPVLSPGVPVSWTYTITISSPAKLYDLTVTDSSGIIPNCDIDGDHQPDGQNVHPGPLVDGDAFVCIATSTASQATSLPYQSSGFVTAMDATGTTKYEASDSAYYTSISLFSPNPSVDITAALNGADATTGPTPAIGEGEVATWTYVVTNTGNVPLTNLIVTTDLAAPNCGVNANVITGPLAPGAAVTCTASLNKENTTSPNVNGQATVVATAIDPTSGADLGAVSDQAATAFTTLQAPLQLAFTGMSIAAAAALAIAILMVGVCIVNIPRNRRRAFYLD